MLSPLMTPQVAIAVDLHAARDPEGEVPDEEDDDKGLRERIDARMENFAEEDRRAEADDAYFDIEFALDRRFQPCRNPEKVADRQAEDH